MPFARAAILVAALLAATVACFVAWEGRPRYRYAVPPTTGDGWETADRSAAKLDTRLLDELFERVRDGTYPNIHSVLLVRDGKLVVEEYFPGKHPVIGETLEREPDWNGTYQSFDRDTLHTLQSATKSVNSILVGIAIDRKFIRDVNEPVRTFFPEMPGDADVRLRHLLSMTAGLEWDETVPLSDPANDCERMNKSDDPVGMLLRRPVIAPPGSTFAYCGAASLALGEIVRKASGSPVDEFAKTQLFEPLGISTYAWRGRFRNGVVHTSGGLYLRPRDMAKIGCMMLNHGRWHGRQIVSEGWARESLRQQAPDRGYGYQWWTRTFHVGDRAVNAAWAGGYGGQFIYLFPDLHLVVVSTGWNPENGGRFIAAMERYILPAARVD
jgi:CubicO group peptidase (beta-lactamase class C family)